MIFIALLRCTEICPVIECCDFDVGLTYCMLLSVLYFGILQCLPGCRQIQLRGVAFIVITRQHFNFNYSKYSPYPSKVQVNVVYVWGSKQNQCLLYFQKHDSRL